MPTILTAFLRIDFNNFEQGYGSLARDLNLTLIEKEIKAPSQKKAVPKPEIIKPMTTIFRSTPQALFKEEVKAILKKYDFYCEKFLDWTKDYCNPTGKGFNHQYDAKTINGDKVVIDKASELMWQQCGSNDELAFEEIED